MQWMQSYSLSIITAAFLFAILNSLIKDAGCKKSVRLLCSLFLTFTMLFPLVKLKLPDEDLWEQFLQPYNGSAADSEKIFAQSISQVISQQTETYILEKAAQWTQNLKVTVITGAELPCAPETVYLEGNADESLQCKIQTMIEQDLGIPKEHQLWIGTSGAGK